MKKRKEKNKNFFHMFAPLVVLIILFLSIGYSSLQSGGIVRDITATVRPEMNIRITDVQIENTSDAIVINKDYNTITNANTITGKVLGEVTFTSTTSQVVYKVEVTNFGNTEMGVASITGLPNELTYSLDTNNYNIGDKICDNTNQSNCTLGAKKYIYITVKYKSGSGSNTSTNYSINMNLNFKGMHKVYYGNTEIDTVIDGGNKTVSLGTNAPANIRVTGTLSNYTYTSPNVVLTGVTSDITIEEVHKIYYDNTEIDTVVDGGNITVNLGANAPNDVTVTGDYASKTYTKPNLTLNVVTGDIYITAAASSSNFSTYITNLVSSITPDSNGIYTPTSGTGCTNQLRYDGTTDNNLRYVGSNPCNYVSFNGETWRIIGVFNNVGSEPLVKIVNATAAYSDSVKFNSNNASGKNKWGTNSLYTSMSTISAATNSMTQSVQWNIGGPADANNTVSEFYTAEIATKSSSLPIGLINASDYGFATDNPSACASANLGNWNVANCSTNHDWLFFSDDGNSFTVTSVTGRNTIYRVQTGRTIYATTINTTSAARAVVFLKSSVLYDSGDGSSGTPFQIK